MGGDRRPLKILHINPERAWGGGESQVIGLLSCLSLWGHQNHLSCHPQGLLILEARKRGVTTFPVSIRNDIDLRPVFPLRRLIQREKYDIVHFHTKRAHALSLWLRGLRPGIKYVVTRRMDYPLKRNWYTHCLYNRQVDGVVAISQKIADLLIEGGVTREKIRVIYSAVDPSLFQGKTFRQEPVLTKVGKIPVIGTVAVLEERKGHRFLLEAMAILKQQGLRLRCLIAGDGREKEKLRGMAASLGLREDVL
ncbi:MAG: glycosyltransferase, partial [Candidatus Binatia bacterium]